MDRSNWVKWLGRFLVLLVCSIVGFLLYTFVFVVWLPKWHDQTALAALLISLLLICLLLMTVSYLRAIFTPPGNVPVQWKDQVHVRNFRDQNEAHRLQPDEPWRYCLKCNTFKPDRSHHCSSCNECVLKMDHHCPWINNCVGFFNYKFFLLFVMYALCSSLVSFGGLVVPAWDHMTHFHGVTNDRDDYLIIVSCWIALVSSICLLVFFSFHMWLVCHNVSTVEFHDYDYLLHPYDIGCCNNFCQVFGASWWQWFLPVADSSMYRGEGIRWPRFGPTANEGEHRILINL
eukprot:gnl/Spiro4/2356_TR1134_c0_g1_i1.p1 gnl/Spiro4/2356_TR1134_c0_g1~~gnl/Spiro4/2356_TR1134_c0_g1_i1.p1  ORF type:complete len:288 (+),score=13.55 gnl/Spiro4/2356_TR1134_c0_g1_i1:39-902(+)